MPPRRSRRIVGSVVRTTTKVVEQTVELAVVENETQSPTPETAGGDNFRRIIPVEETVPAPAQTTEDIEVTPETDSKARDVKREGKKGGRRRRRRKGGGEGYKRYVLMVLKQVHPGMAISGQAMVILSNLMNDMFERLAQEATTLSKYTGRTTLSSREIQGAVRLVLPGELGKHAIAEGTKALSTFLSNHGLPKY